MECQKLVIRKGELGSSHGRPAGVDVGGGVVDDGEDEASESGAHALEIEGAPLSLEVGVHHVQGGVDEEVPEDGLDVASRLSPGSVVPTGCGNLGADVGGHAGGEGGVGEAVVEGIQELDQVAVLELGQEVDLSGLRQVNQVSRVVLPVGVLGGIEHVADVCAGGITRRIASGSGVSDVVLETKAHTKVEVGDIDTNSGEVGHGLSGSNKASESKHYFVHHLLEDLN